ncbi:MAG: ABC transporter ATP-binding protein [Gammaproteobacteria bacterium]|jgi:iron complex transport system ATP-binding protein|nr:ABC transporter ATP-binding protein [Gammaproteobacteria bacterium]MBT4491778.1 ABC transporter ATP-binding protein [Gammaproteobacteria bacterium]MBT7372203.1 ABC transporter ATP-binding protein [Gammaproteobacteria bacterium]
MTELVVNKLGYVRGNKQILDEVSFSIGKGELVVLLGANGAGKSSVLKCALEPKARVKGSVYLNGQPLDTLSPANRARLVAYLPQSRPVAWPVKVFDVVSLGRYAYGVRLGQLKGRDLALVEAAIVDCQLQHLRDRRIDTLSGGEAARVHCARAFAANADVLLADEPTASLDPKHQLGIMKLIRDYVDGGRGALVVAHEANLAARFADRLIWIRNGRIVADGSVDETMTENMVAEVYGVSSEISRIRGYHNVSIVDAL